MNGSLLYDDICRISEGERRRLFETPQVERNFYRAIVFNVDNVSQYTHSMAFAHGKIEWGPPDYPNVAPVFEVMWLETKLRHMDFYGGNRSGVLVSSTRLDNGGWLMGVQWFFEAQSRRIIRAPVLLVTEVNSDGGIANDETRCKKLETEDFHRWTRAFEAIAVNSYLSLAFMHCKNVEAIENAPPRLPITKKRAQHPPRTKFYTLNIKPMQRILEDEGHASTTGLKMALHICRGHFKHFGGEHGKLFGRLEGTYWWESQVRGDKKHGEVKKDYSVSPS